MNAPTDNDWIERATAELHASGRRAGGARAEVIAQLSSESCAVSAEQLDRKLTDSGRRVGRASIYRALEALAEIGLVQRVELGEGGSRWERIGAAGYHHHHHLVCGSCGRVIPFRSDALEAALGSVSERDDFNVNGHDVTLHGQCSGCAQRQAA